eukprot:Em0020g146a
MDFVEGLVIWMRQPLNALLVCVIFLALVWVVLKTNRLRRRALSFRILDSCRTHRWHYSEYLDKPTYCNSCLQLCLSGSSCGSCGVCVCSLYDCLGQANRLQQCKPLTVPSREQTPHFWVKGNLPLSSLCYKCMSPCGNVPKLCDFRCVWCAKTAHDSCISNCPNGNDDSCSLGPFRSLVLPPNCVQVALEGWRGQRRLVIKTITPPAVNEWKPLVVMANLQSGGKDGEKVLSTFRKLLNPVQVIDLSETSPEAGLDICRLLPSHSSHVLVCGGDGTVGWVLEAIGKSKLPVPPRVGILPLGTGNDLARVLGWGKGYVDEDIADYLTDLEHAQLSMLDRWKVTVEHRRYLGLKRSPKVVVMNNYMGIGCDAGVALNFHRQRQSRPELFQSRLINKAWYLVFGARDVLEQSGKDLHKKIEVQLDGVPHKLLGLEGIVVLNINSWSAGCTMWSDTIKDGLGPSRMDDQLLEVVGLYSSIHIGKIQVSLSEALRLGQAKELKIIVHESIPLQVDGEPWQQGPSTITITHHGQAHMLKKVSHE